MTKKALCILLSLCAALIAATADAAAQDVTGRDIMLKAENREKADTSSFQMEMILINAGGSKRVREVSAYKKEYAGETKSVMVFLKPADVTGVGYLSFSYDEASKDDDRWLYMPALKKSRRISGSSGGDYFMGTDFTYDDMSGHKTDDYEHKLLGTETQGGKTCWKIESTPKQKSAYSKFVSWIDRESLLQTKAEFYDKQGALLKVLTADSIEKVNGFWIAKKMEMVNVQKKHTTVLLTKKIEFNKDIPDSFFRVSSLESGKIK
ncbi:outer membrane lipoprotein-sorting protein [Treponema sp. OMZ 840]|uniref:outer membrane lipoprotein-sorting protein n=1 Tax=Treponema sp. OMZ 840 TaxID=244313 RepID=UPI003D913260